MKKVINLSILVLSLVLASCSANYRMTTCIHKDGNVDREVYAQADSAFLAGDKSKNPYLFQLGKEWKVEYLDSCMKVNFFGEEDSLNVKVSRTMQVSGKFSLFSSKENWMNPLAVPQERLEKHFRWFYTYYTYTCDFQEVTDKGPVPIEKYLNEQERALFFQGDMAGYQGMNGMELKQELDDMEQKFMKWYYRTRLELSYDVVEHFLQVTEDTTYLLQVKRDKYKFFDAAEEQKKMEEYSPDYVCKLLDKRYATTTFSKLYMNNEQEMNHLFDEKCASMELFGNQIKFELAMPGKLISANALLEEDGRLVWKVDAYRLLGGNYILQAESRTVNIWAFCVTVFFIFIGVYWGIRKK